MTIKVTSSQATTQPARPSTWRCQVSADLRGNGQHFLYYGRDAWDGNGSIYCESGKDSKYRPINVSFNSLYDGFGADKNSELQVVVNMTTSVDPANIQLRGLVADHDEGPSVNWQFLSARRQAQVFITNTIPAVTKRSLQYGTLYIRGSGE